MTRDNNTTSRDTLTMTRDNNNTSRSQYSDDADLVDVVRQPVPEWPW